MPLSRMISWLKRSPLKTLAVILTILGGLYLLTLGVALGSMYLPPEGFAWIVGRTPGLIWKVAPFDTFWTFARDGGLDIGDQAPDFELPAPDKSPVVRLSSFRGQEPVVLVFGSYT